MDLLSLFILFFSLYVFFTYLRPKPTQNTGFKTYPIFGTLPDFLVNRHRFLDWTTSVLSKCPTNTSVFRRPGKVHGIITANPSNVEYILKTNFDNYPKGTRFISLLEDFLGHGIFNSDGNLWKTQRKTASYEFSTKSLRNFVMESVRLELETRLIPIFQKKAKSDQGLDLQDVLERFAFDNICKLAFNFDPGCLGGDATYGGDFMQDFEEAANLSSGRFMYALPYLYLIKKYFNLGSEQKLMKSIATVHRFADDIIESRLQSRAENEDKDLLSRFIGAGNEFVSPSYLRDIVISFILAGRDTTSSALSWFFWLLSRKPEIEEKIIEEVREVRARLGKPDTETFSFEELREMHYLQAAISESMRLYPPVPVDTKACLSDDVLPDGTFVAKDWFVTYHTYAMGRMESIWGQDCGEFKPERWIETTTGFCKQESPFKYPVFHAGPRMCLGKEMAYIQMKSIAASIIERFKVCVQINECPEHLLSLTLRMKGGLPIKLKERKTNE